MYRIDLDNPKFVLVIAGLFSMVLSFVILRALLLNHGIVESIDIQWNNYVNMFELWFHTWNFYTGGSQIIFVSQFPVYSLVLVFKNVALAQRVTYFSIISLISFNMFLVTFYSLRRKAHKTGALYLSSIIASLLYVLNPLVFTEIFHISFLWSYSLFPLVFYFTWRALNSVSRRKVVVSSLLLGVFFAFMTDAWGMAVGAFLFVILALSTIVLNFRKNLTRRFISNLLLTVFTMGLAALLLASYWLLPYITQKASGPVWDPFSATNLFLNSQDSNLLNILGLHSWSTQPFFNPTPLWNSLTLILLIFAVSAILIRRSKSTLTLSGLLVIGVFLAQGTKGLFGEFYLWLTFYSPRIIPNQAFLLKYPYLFLAIVDLAAALLSAVLIVEVFERAKFNGFSLKRFLPKFLKRFSLKSYSPAIVLFFIIVSLIALVGAPLLTNLNGALNPVVLPSQYDDLNQYLTSQGGSFRVMWVPESAIFTWSNNYWANKIEYWASGVPPLMYGWGVSASPTSSFLGNMIYDYLNNNQTLHLGKILALANVRYIVFHNDTSDSKSYSGMLSNLLNTTSTDLQLAKSWVLLDSHGTPDGAIYLFENMDMPDYFQTFSKVNLVVGGLDTIGSLSSINGFYPAESASIFLENQPISNDSIVSILTSKDIDKTLIFYGNKTFNDLVLDTIDDSALIAPGDSFSNTALPYWLTDTTHYFTPEMSNWTKDAVTSFTWTPIILPSLVNTTSLSDKYDFGLGHSLIYTSNSSSLFTSLFNVKNSGQYDLWTRVLFGSSGGNLSFTINDAKISPMEINTNSTVLTGFNWVHLGEVNLVAGSHKLTISNKSGTNAVNLVALPTTIELAEHTQKLLDLINQSGATIAYITGEPFLLNSTKYDAQGENTTFSEYAPKTSSYLINVQTDQSLNSGMLELFVDNKPYAISANPLDGQYWYSAGPINLTQDYHDITFNYSASVNIENVILYSSTKSNSSLESLKSVFGDRVEPYVVNYEKSGPVTFSVKINASAPFILAFNEPSDDFWQINASGTKLALNSLNNAFLINNTEDNLVTLDVFYAPEVSLQLGEKISVISFVSVLATISVLLVLPKIKGKRCLNLSNSPPSSSKKD